MQCQEDAQKHSHWFKRIIKEVEDEEERKIHNIQTEYEMKLHTEKDANKNLKGEAGAMTQKVSKENKVFPLVLLHASNVTSCVSLLPVGGRLRERSSTVCRDRWMTSAQT